MMKKLTRPAELVELSNARSNYVSIQSADKAWEKFGENGDRTKVREQLEAVQNDLCAYCENSLENNAHIDHFKPKSKNRNLTFEWENLIVSCKHSDSCGEKKGKRFESYWINPYLIDPSEIFKFYSDGQIEGITPDAKKVIEDFGLNCPRLEKKRKGILSAYESNLLAIADFPDAIEYYKNMDYPMFPTAYKQIIEKIIGA